MASNDVFVFGSNQKGLHGAGAALDARHFYGAVQWWGTGLQGAGSHGTSWGICTKDRNLRALSFTLIRPGVDEFLQFAHDHPEKYCLVTRVGTGYAGQEGL